METNIIIQNNINESAEFSIIQSKIHIIRGQKVLLDFDLAEMYQIPTKRLKEQVRRNIERFPDDFMFQLTSEELQLVAKCDQFPERIKHSSVIPLAFTQEGVAMLSSVLRSQIAIDTNILIMRAFVAIRQYSLNYSELKNELDKLNIKVNVIYEIFDKLFNKEEQPQEPRNQIGFKQKIHK